MTILFDDKRAALRLAEYPEFLLRPDEFVASFQALGRPGIILQARPAAEAALYVDVDAADVQMRFTAGAGRNGGWWDSFHSTILGRPTMQGLGSAPRHEKPDWAIEAHFDGHFIAGVWNFPELEYKGSEVPGIGYWYDTLFDDFFAVIGKTLGSGVSVPRYFATMTLFGASRLHYFKRHGMFDRPVHGAEPLSVDVVQYPVWQAAFPSAEWNALPAKMARALRGTYGVFPAPK